VFHFIEKVEVFYYKPPRRKRVQEEDKFRWKWTTDGQFSTKTAYRTFFHGSTVLPSAAQVWNSLAGAEH
jgi:hypothetical protein